MPKSLTRSNSVYTFRNPKGDPFCYSPKHNRDLELIGLVLWVTEGDKTQISLANGNIHVIKKYLEFLRTVCHLREDKIKVVIHCHDTIPYKKCVRYWSRLTGVPPRRFNKPFIKKDKGGSRNFSYGICRIVASNSRLVAIFKDRLKAIGLERD